MIQTTNPYEHVTDCILKDVLDGFSATAKDIDHCAMMTMVDALRAVEADSTNTDAVDKYNCACSIVNEVMSEPPQYSDAVAKLKGYWKDGQ